MPERGWRPDPPAYSAFESVARLYGPADAALRAAFVDAGERWRVDGIPDPLPAAAIWGNVPTDGHSRSRTLRWGPLRELALRSVRAQYRDAVRAVHRLPPAVRPGVVPDPVRRFVIGGLLVELRPGPAHERTIDAVIRAAGGAAGDSPKVRPSREGSALVRLDPPGVGRLELRVAAIGSRKDVGDNAKALDFLERHSVAHVPRLAGSGAVASAAWTTETHLPGRQSRRLDDELFSEAARFCAGLPVAEAPTSLGERMRSLADHYPRWAGVANRLAERPLPWPGVVQHGDMWTGNLLTTEHGLSGVIDWDSWHPAGMPGVDLLQLLAIGRRLRTGDDIGDLWLSGLWRSPEFVDATRPYWRQLGIDVTDELLEAVGLDWWVGQLLKRRRMAVLPGWLERNVDEVLAVLDRAP